MGWLGRGSRGMNVRRIQGLLYQAGAYDGKIDGLYGIKTQRAVRNWQDLIGAKADGLWGARTIDQTMQVLGWVNSPKVSAGGAPVVPTLPSEDAVKRTAAMLEPTVPVDMSPNPDEEIEKERDPRMIAFEGEQYDG